NQGRWLVDPYSAKALGDRIFTLGINRYIFHRYAHQPWLDLEPGMTMGPWGMNLDRTITWWNQGEAWMKYITRCQFLLQSGRFVADVVAFTGEEGPNDLPMMKGKEIPEGYDYDGCDATVLHQMRVENGQIVLPTGMRYRVLMLPQSKVMTTRTIRKIAQLVNDGAIVVGPAPEKSPSLADYPAGDQEILRTAAQVWQSSANRHAYANKTVRQILVDKQISPDLTSTRPVNWIHRVDKGADIYFVANPTYRPVDIDVSFRIGDRQPELWNPETGAMENAPVWRNEQGRTTVSMRMEAAGSTFVVFRKAPVKKHLTALTWLGESDKEPKMPKIEILSARYQATDGSGGVDVTEKAKSLMAHGETSLEATNSNFGDPAFNHVKHLLVVYTVDGKRFERKISENGSLEFMPQLPDNAVPNFLMVDGKIQPWKPGKIRFAMSDGTTGTVDSKPTNVVVNVPWKVTFPPQKGAPASITLDKLISWSDSTNAGVKYFSGTAKYETTFTYSSKDEITWLDLGKVKNFAEVELNGHKFDTLWKAPFRLDVSKFLKSGSNSLVVKVTNLWPNRLIGDEQFPPQAKYNGGPITEWPQWILDGKPRPASNRIGFATWKFYDKDSPLLDSGLIGPVRLVSPKSIDPRSARGNRIR
ncbi:MAG: glycosyl hydrolase, partial [Armatimonadota bacterium]